MTLHEALVKTLKSEPVWNLQTRMQPETWHTTTRACPHESRREALFVSFGTKKATGALGVALTCVDLGFRGLGRFSSGGFGLLSLGVSEARVEETTFQTLEHLLKTFNNLPTSLQATMHNPKSYTP